VEDGCKLKTIFFVDPLQSKKRLIGFEPRLKLLAKEAEKIEMAAYFTPYGYKRAYTSTSIDSYPCSALRFVEVTEAPCALKWTKQKDDPSDLGWGIYENCLGPLPRKVPVTFKFDPDNRQQLLPVTALPPYTDYDEVEILTLGIEPPKPDIQ